VTDAGNSQIFSDDFETGAQAQWSSTRTDQFGCPPFSRACRAVQQRERHLDVDDAGGTNYTVRFDLYVLDSWDGLNTSVGPDYFNVFADSTRIFHEASATTLPPTCRPIIPAPAGNIPLQIVPVDHTSNEWSTGSETFFTLFGSGFMKGRVTITVGGVVLNDRFKDGVDGDVSGARNDRYDNLLAALAVDGPVQITTAGGSSQIAGPGFGLRRLWASTRCRRRRRWAHRPIRHCPR